MHTHSCTHKHIPHTHTHSHVHPSPHTHRKDIWFDDVELEMVDGEPVPKRPHIESTHVPLVTGSDERYIHIVHMCVTSLQLTGYFGSWTLTFRLADHFKLFRIPVACYHLMETRFLNHTLMFSIITSNITASNIILDECMTLWGEPEWDVCSHCILCKYTTQTAQRKWDYSGVKDGIHALQELGRQAEADTHMVFTDAAYHALGTTDGTVESSVVAAGGSLLHSLRGQSRLLT